MSDLSSQTRRLPLIAVVISTLLLAFVLFHAALITAYNTPKNLLTPVIGTTVDRYVMPYFSQAWSLFAPDPGKEDLDYEVRYRYTFANGNMKTSPYFRGNDIFSPALAAQPFNALDVFRQISYACMTLGEDYIVEHKVQTQTHFTTVSSTSVNAAEECLTRLALVVQDPRATVEFNAPVRSVAVQITYLSYATTPVTQHFFQKSIPTKIMRLYTSPWITSDLRDNGSVPFMRLAEVTP